METPLILPSNEELESLAFSSFGGLFSDGCAYDDVVSCLPSVRELVEKYIQLNLDSQVNSHATSPDSIGLNADTKQKTNSN